jgi:ketosteroid isomerase-like protein
MPTKDRSECMPDRPEIDRLVRGMYAARLGESLDALCGAFSDDAVFHIAGAGQTSPISNTAVGVAEFRPLLASMIKAFKLRNHTIHAILIEGSKAAVHWRADIHSRITGTSVPTEFVDLLEFRDGRIAFYTEFFVPQSGEGSRVRAGR